MFSLEIRLKYIEIQPSAEIHNIRPVILLLRKQDFFFYHLGRIPGAVGNLRLL